MKNIQFYSKKHQQSYFKSGKTKVPQLESSWIKFSHISVQLQTNWELRASQCSSLCDAYLSSCLTNQCPRLSELWKRSVLLEGFGLSCHNLLMYAASFCCFARKASLDLFLQKRCVHLPCPCFLPVCRNAVSLSLSPLCSHTWLSGLLWHTSVCQLQQKHLNLHNMEWMYVCFWKIVITNEIILCKWENNLQKRSADILDSLTSFCFGICAAFVSHWFTTWK